MNKSNPLNNSYSKLNESSNLNYISINQKSIIDTVSKKKYVFWSLFPMYLSVIIGIVYPKLIRKYLLDYILYIFC